MKDDEFYIKNENVEDCYLLLETTIISISGRFRQANAEAYSNQGGFKIYHGYHKEDILKVTVKVYYSGGQFKRLY